MNSSSRGPGGTQRTEMLLHKHKRFPLANVTSSYGYRGRLSVMHSCSSDRVATIYMHAEAEAGEFGGAAGVLGKAASSHTPLQALHTGDDVAWGCPSLSSGNPIL